MGVWWELWEKYEKELVKLDPWEDDDEELLKEVDKDAKKDKKKDSKKSAAPKKDKKSKVIKN